MSSYSNSSFSFFHTNIRSLNVIWKISSLRSKRFQSSYGAKVSAGAKKKVFFAFVPTFHDELARKPLLLRLENFQTHLLDELTFRFNILGIAETRIKSACDNLDFNPTISHYNFEHVPTPLSAGGVGMYIDENLKYTIIEKCSNEAFQALWVELHLPKHANIICGVVYRQHNSPELFQEYFDRTIEKLSASGKQIFLMGDFNINLLRFHDCKYAQNFILSLQSFNLTPTIDKPTRVHHNSYSLIDNIFASNLEDTITSGNIISDLTDHFSQFCITFKVKKYYSVASLIIQRQNS